MLKIIHLAYLLIADSWLTLFPCPLHIYTTTSSASRAFRFQTTINFSLIIPVQPQTWLYLGKVERKQIKDKFTSNYDEALPDTHYRTIYFYSQRTARQQPGTDSSNTKMIIPGSEQLPAAKVSSGACATCDGGVGHIQAQLRGKVFQAPGTSPYLCW